MPINDENRRQALGRVHQRHAFTLLELLVSISVIGLLLTLTLTAVMVAREASRRTECVNRLRQLVLATHQFETAHRTFPNADTGTDGLLDPIGRLPTNHSSGFWRLLPYFGYESLSEEVRYVRFQGAQRTTTDSMPRSTRIRLDFLLCPSDAPEEGTNYRFNGGSNPTCFPSPSLSPALRPDGPFGASITRGFASIRGGTSTTAAFSERLKALSVRYDHRAHIWGARLRGEFETADIDHDLLWSLGTALGTAEPSSYTPLAGRSWHGGGKHFTIYDHVFPPNAPMPAVSAGSSRSSVIEITGAVPPTSRHSGGVNAAILDGSVRFVADGIDLKLWRSLGSIDDRP